MNYESFIDFVHEVTFDDILLVFLDDSEERILDIYILEDYFKNKIIVHELHSTEKITITKEEFEDSSLFYNDIMIFTDRLRFKQPAMESIIKYLFKN
jgi:hypothetical protein